MKMVLYFKGFPPREYGGPVVAGYHLLREFLRNPRVLVTLIVQTDCTEAEIRHSLGMPGNLNILRLRYYPSFHDIRTLPQAAKVIRNVDLIHFNSFPFRHIVYLLLAKLRGIPTALRVGGLLSAEADSTFGPSYPLAVQVVGERLKVRFPSIVIRLLLYAYRRFTSFWSAVVMNSEALKRSAVEEESFNRDQIRIIPNGVDLPTRNRTPPKPHDGPPRLLFVGKLEEIKGPDLLLTAMRLLAEEGQVIDLSIVGTGSLESKLRDWAGNLRQHQTTFYGFRHGEELEKLYEWADLVVIPSRYDSFPLVALEAMAWGKAIIATAVGGIPEILDDPRNALLVDPDSRSLATGIRQLIEDTDLRIAMARANAEDAHRYSWSSVARRYLSLYEELVRGRKRV